VQVVAMDPISIDRANCPQKVLDRERELLMEQAKAQMPKNADVLAKIVNGRLEKFFKANCLLDQPFILDDKVTVGKLLSQLSKEFEGKFRVTKFACMKVGHPPRLCQLA
jgi:elongation factor Ts